MTLSYVLVLLAALAAGIYVSRGSSAMLAVMVANLTAAVFQVGSFS